MLDHMSKPRWWIRTLAGVSLAACLGGCASPAGPIFDAGREPRVWPTPPDAPRIQFVGQLRDSSDLRPSRSGVRRLGDAIFGRAAPVAMQNPMGVCNDGSDRLFVADGTGQVVHVYDLRARRYEAWTPPKGQSPFLQPTALSFDPAGRLLVADTGAGRILAFNADGKFLGRFGGAELLRPCGLVVDAPRRRVLVVDVAAHCIVALSLDGMELGRFGERGSRPGQFNYPTSIALDSRGNIYVSDTLNFRIQVFDPEFRPIRQIGRKGDMPGYFSQPKGIALDGHDRLFVVDANFEAVQIFNDEGALLLSFGREGHGPGEFWLPVGVSIDSAGRVFIADSFNRRIQAFEQIAGEERP